MGFKFFKENKAYDVRCEPRWVEMTIPYDRGAESLRIRCFTDLDFISLEGIIMDFAYEPSTEFTVRNIYQTMSQYSTEVEVLPQF